MGYMLYTALDAADHLERKGNYLNWQDFFIQAGIFTPCHKTNDRFYMQQKKKKKCVRAYKVLIREQQIHFK